MADRYWIASSTASWNNTANWSTSSGGSGGASVPGSSDVAIFDGGGIGNCNLNMSPTVASFDVRSGYTGIFNGSGYNLIIDPNDIVVSSGTVIAGAGTWTFKGNFSVAAGATFSAINDTYIYAYKNYTINPSANYIEGSNVVEFLGSSNSTLNMGGKFLPYLWSSKNVGSELILASNISARTIKINSGTFRVTGFNAVTRNSPTCDLGPNFICATAQNWTIQGILIIRNNTCDNNMNFICSNEIQLSGSGGASYPSFTINDVLGYNRISHPGGQASSIYSLTVNSGKTFDIHNVGGQYLSFTYVYANGALSNSSNSSGFRINNLSIGISGSLSGSPIIDVYSSITNLGYIDSPLRFILSVSDIPIGPGDYRNSTFKLFRSSGFGSLSLSAGNFYLSSIESVASSPSWKNNGAVNLYIKQGITNTSGSLSWTKGTGSIHFIGTGDYTILGFNYENMYIEKNSSITLTADITVTSLTISSGIFDKATYNINTNNFTINGGIFDPGGSGIITATGTININYPGQINITGLGGTTWNVVNFSAMGQSGNLITLNASSTWYLNVSNSGSASFVDAAYSNASGGNQITANESTNDLNNTNWNFIYPVANTQVYVTGVLYQESAYPDDPSILFSIVDEKFREITEMTYEYLDINRSENRFSNGTTREQLLIFMKDVFYNTISYLTDSQSAALRTALINKLNTISGLTYSDVEIRTTRVTQ